MDHPYRLSENESIIVDTRLNTLERQTESLTMWRWITFTIAIISILACGYSIGTQKTVKDTPCLDELKIVTRGTFSNTVETTCSHPKHRSTVSETSWKSTVHCVCQ